jgi:hypothetical protein
MVQETLKHKRIRIPNVIKTSFYSNQTKLFQTSGDNKNVEKGGRGRRNLG